jgi:hypothetical protein
MQNVVIYKNLPVMGLCGRCFLEFIGWRKRISCEHSAMQVFSTQLCDLYSPLLSLSPLLYGSTLPPSPLPCVNKCAV